MLSHRIRPVSEILAPHVEHLWVVRGYLPARWRNTGSEGSELIIDTDSPQQQRWSNATARTIGLEKNISDCR
jgi:hypothetical protein